MARHERTRAKLVSQSPARHVALLFPAQWILVATALLACAPAEPPPTVTLEGLLHEMTDLRHLARFPNPPYTHRLASSTDPGAHAPSDPNSWFKNEDMGHYVRKETRNGRTEHVLLDAAGPGAVMRIWSANPKGTLRIYIDGAETPTFEANMEKLLSGQVAPFAYPFAYVAARGRNLYFPLPYRERCKITMDADDAFYQVNYRTYPPLTDVVSFSAEALERLAPTIRETAAKIRAPDSLATGQRDLRFTHFKQKTRIDGPAAVVELSLAPENPTPERLRTWILVVRADGQETVRVPLGDFFGSGPGAIPYESMMASVSEKGVFTVRWPMPFQRQLEIEIEGGDPAHDFKGKVAYAPWHWNERSLYFHASWRHDDPRPSWPPRDWTVVSISGRGVYAGTLLEISNSSKAWWGEGDEKIWVDDEDFPSHFGTGTEDYFGYAWSTPVPFARPYHSQTLAEGPGGYGSFSMNRWHVLDPIPFTRRLIFDQEIWHWSKTASLSLAAVAFFYADLDATTNAEAPRPGEAVLQLAPPLPKKTVRGALEAERMETQTSDGRAEPQRMVRYLGGYWSEDTQLHWHGAKPGATLDLRFAADVPGAYRVRANLTKGRGYGVAHLAVGADTAGAIVDLGSPSIRNLDDVDLGVHELSATDNRLRVEIRGPSRQSPEAGTDFGIDLIWLEPVP